MNDLDGVFMDGDTQIIKSDETLLAILRTVHELSGASIPKLSEELPFAKSTIFRHLMTLKKHEFVTVNQNEYQLGLKFLSIGERTRQKLTIVPVAHKKTEKLADITGEKVWAIVEEHGEAVYVYGAEGENAIQTDTRIGDRTNLHHLAGGKAILAHLPMGRVEQFFSRSDLPATTENTITSTQSLSTELDEIRTKGFAFNFEESMIGLNAIAAPILTPTQDVLGALSITGPANRLTRSKMEEELVEVLLGASGEIGVELGYSDHSFGEAI